jgi:hypothetical protein
MFNQYSFKQKFIALIVLFFILCITAYKRSFSLFIQLYNEHVVLTEKMEKVNSESKNLSVLESEIEKLDSYIGKQNIDKDKIQDEILNFISVKYQNIRIVKLNPIHVFENDKIGYLSNEIEVSGEVNDLLKLSLDLEKQFDYSKIRSLKYFTVIKNNTVTGLHLKILFQSYENI